MTASRESGALGPLDGEIVPARPLDGSTRDVSVVQSGPPAHEVLAWAWEQAQTSPRTAAAYRSDIKLWFTFCTQRGVDPLRAHRVNVDQYRHELTAARYSNSTIARRITAVSSFYSYAVRYASDRVRENPAAGAKRPSVSQESTTRGLEVEEAERLLDEAADHGPRALAIVDLMLCTAVRISEVVEADVGDLVREGDDLLLRVTRKGGADQHMLLSPGTATSLFEYLGGRRSGPLFLSERTGRRATRQQIGHLIGTLARRAELVNPGERLVSPHSLRHTAATAALDDPDTDIRQVQALMGHAETRTTGRYDRHAKEASRAAARTLGNLWHRDRPGR